MAFTCFIGADVRIPVLEAVEVTGKAEDTWPAAEEEETGAEVAINCWPDEVWTIWKRLAANHNKTKLPSHISVYPHTITFATALPYLSPHLSQQGYCIQQHRNAPGHIPVYLHTITSAAAQHLSHLPISTRLAANHNTAIFPTTSQSLSMPWH